MRLTLSYTYPTVISASRITLWFLGGKVMLDWFNLSLWLFALIAGLILLILSSIKEYIDWVKQRIPMPEDKIIRMEKIGAISLITISALSLIKILVKH